MRYCIGEAGRLARMLEVMSLRIDERHGVSGPELVMTADEAVALASLICLASTGLERLADRLRFVHGNVIKNSASAA